MNSDVLDVGPVALSVVRKLRRQVLTGDLTEGMELPSVRRLAHMSGTGVVTANRALQRVESEGWAERYVGRRLRVAKGAIGRAQAQLEREPPVVIVRLAESHTRVGWEGESSQMFDGFAHVFPRCSIRHVYVNLSEGMDSVAQVVHQYDGISAEVGYVLAAMPRAVKRFFAARGVPCVVHGYAEPDIELPCVYEDMVKLGRTAAELLWQSGRMVALCSQRLVGSESHILEGIRQVAASMGEPEPRHDEFYYHMPKDVDEFAPMIDRLLSGNDPPRSVIGIRPEYAISAVQVGARRGIRIPADLQVVGLHHHPMYRFTYPEVTSIGPRSMTALGERCAELLARSLGGRRNVATRIVVESTLVERGSTLPVALGHGAAAMSDSRAR